MIILESALILMFCVIGLIGWCWNIIKIIDAGEAPATGLVLARAIGVFVLPLGAILGYL